MADFTDRQLADEILAHLDGHDAAHTVEVAELAEALEVDDEQVRRVLDEFLVRRSPKRVEHKGPGQGGGWASDPAHEDFGTAEPEPAAARRRRR